MFDDLGDPMKPPNMPWELHASAVLQVEERGRTPWSLSGRTRFDRCSLTHRGW